MVPRRGPSDTHSSLPSSTTAGSACPAEDQGASQQFQPAPASHLVTVQESLLSSGALDRVIQVVSQSHGVIRLKTSITTDGLTGRIGAMSTQLHV